MNASERFSTARVRRKRGGGSTIAPVKRGQKMLLGVAFAAATIAAGSFTYYELLKAGLVHYGKYDHRDRGSLRVGALAPDLDLTMYDGTPVRLSKLWSERPAFLVFGSCT
jgi:hypothetical protein